MSAIDDIIVERKRQIEVHQFTAVHDDNNVYGELSIAAACYALVVNNHHVPRLWPWHSNWWKPKDRRRNLVKAGALIIAEIERIDRER